MGSTAAKLPATEADFFAIPEEERLHELYGGEIVERALPSGRHGATQVRLSAGIRAYYRRSDDSDGPGGWRFASEVETWLAEGVIVRPDLAGWRRERLPAFPDTSPIDVRPGWVCEILSRSNAYAELGYQVVLDVGAGAAVAEPFEDLELAVAELFDDGE